ncbi:MAG TPA: peptidoglycan-binding protein [Acidimicrobiales bacterium]|nr:peptidoglycan-binding protein [Acidimicrobiales bacterium]
MPSTSPPGATALPLRRGDRGPAVEDLQRRLAGLGATCDDPPGDYGASTEEAVRRFQRQRGLPDHGTCDRDTWQAVVEAGYRLGDRLLYRRSPMLRGDDVAELQRRLSALGFDPGRIDGIFGDDTARALADFQRNAGLLIDAICGRRTLEELWRLEPRPGGHDLVSPLAERLRVARDGAGGLAGRRVGVGEPGGFPQGVVAVCRALGDVGAVGLAFHHFDPSRQAAEANAAGVACFISLVLDPESGDCVTAYYRGFHYESLVSRSLAELAQSRLPKVLDLGDGGVTGMASPILRETRMPAIEVRLGRPEVVVQRTAELGQALVEALSRWVTTDLA